MPIAAPSAHRPNVPRAGIPAAASRRIRRSNSLIGGRAAAPKAPRSGPRFHKARACPKAMIDRRKQMIRSAARFHPSWEGEVDRGEAAAVEISDCRASEALSLSQAVSRTPCGMGPTTRARRTVQTPHRVVFGTSTATGREHRPQTGPIRAVVYSAGRRVPRPRR